MARKAAAMPQLVRRNWRRFKPSRLPLMSANSLMRASTFFWVALCEGGKYSPFDTIWVGTGVAADADSAPATRPCSRSLSQLPIVSLPVLMLIDQLPVVNGRPLRPGSAQIMTRVCDRFGLRAYLLGTAPRSDYWSAMVTMPCLHAGAGNLLRRCCVGRRSQVCAKRRKTGSERRTVKVTRLTR